LLEVDIYTVYLLNSTKQEATFWYFIAD
jgi:hypothetical protein